MAGKRLVAASTPGAGSIDGRTEHAVGFGIEEILAAHHRKAARLLGIAVLGVADTTNLAAA
jgi:hypothetical protein